MNVDTVFCFKQKTAYEMRISDWSSDVCSSDLIVGSDCGLVGNDLPLKQLRYAIGVEANPVKSLRRDKIGPVVVIAGPHEQKRTGDIEDPATPSFPSANAGYKASDACRRISRPSLRFHKPANAKAYRGIVFIIMHRFGFVGFLSGAFARQAQIGRAHV